MTELVPEAEPFDGDVQIPPELPVLPLKDTVVFPQSMTPLAIGQERSVKLVDAVVSGDRMLALLTVREPDIEQPGLDDVYEIGTAGLVHRMIRIPDGTLRILVQGLGRIHLDQRVSDDPYPVGRFSELPDVVTESREVQALTRTVQNQFARVVELVPTLPDELQLAAANIEDPGVLTYLVASTLRLKTEEKQELLEMVDVKQRLRATAAILSRELEVFELGSKIQSQVESEMEKTQRDYFLRQQLKAIQDELGEGDPDQVELEDVRQRIDEANLPEEALKAAKRELARLERLPSAAAEYGVIRTYLDWILSVPWNETTPDNLDLVQARKVLDADHYDLEKIKERILESLAVGKLKGDVSGQILCFVGPPGVGKTSLGQSIAKALGRKFVRISVGGVRDESEIRGHRRTYIGAMPGTIVRALRDAESRNPVFMIDEIDKMGADWRGDPASAMLEILDPQQNSSFRDHYLDLPFDLSKVLFVCTANQLETIPPPLLDRMDVIELPGYTEDEKLEIAKRYLVPKQLREHGLAPAKVEVAVPALRVIVREYTREAGVRGLERRIADLCRKAARKVTGGYTRKIRIDEKQAREWLGPRRFSGEVRKRTSDPGVATGLAVTAVGGDILFIEATAYPGKGTADRDRTARRRDAGVRARGALVGAQPRGTARHRSRVVLGHDIHVHVPAGAVPKDGPSAGITIATALVSLARGKPVSSDVAMTGEITLTGQVLQIGGLRDKVLAAQRAGVHKVIIPRENEPDLVELPPEAREQLQFVLADTIEDVLGAAFDGAGGVTRRPPTRQARPRATAERRAAKTA